MMRRFSIFRSFQFSSVSRGQKWLPLVALALVSLEGNAAVDGDARVQISRQQTQIAQLQNQMRSIDTWRTEAQTQGELLQVRYDGLYDVPKDLSTPFVSLREDHARLTGGPNDVHDTHQDLQDRFSLILAQVQTLSDEQRIAGQKLAQVESEGANRGVVQLLNRMEGLNGDLNRLRGQIEVLTNDINNAQKRQRDMYVDLDTRLRRMEQQSAAARKDQEALPALEERVRKLEQAAAGLTTIPAPVASAAAAAAPPGAATTVSAPADPPAAPTAAAAQPSLPPARLSAVDAVAIQRAYDNAYSNYRISDYHGAIRGFDGFLKTYPKHQLAPNAQYWIGESHFHMHDYRAAIEAQRRLLGTYPDSAKVPDALLIIGTAESNMGDNGAARKTFEELIARYPSTESAEKAKARLAKLK
jgi:tol-pal system protein YbgF